MVRSKSRWYACGMSALFMARSLCKWNNRLKVKVHEVKRPQEEPEPLHMTSARDPTVDSHHSASSRPLLIGYSPLGPIRDNSLLEVPLSVPPFAGKCSRDSLFLHMCSNMSPPLFLILFSSVIRCVTCLLPPVSRLGYPFLYSLLFTPTRT
jgi:hypothetical protein